MTESSVTTCYRHPDRRAGVACQRCDKMICPSCMVQAPVGFQCPGCVKESAARAPVYTSRSLAAWTPFVTYALIAVNLLVYVAELATLYKSSESLLFAYQGTVADAGVLFGPAVGAGEWYRLVTGGFLHAGVIHVGMNMFVLYRIGPQVERVLGHVRYIGLYFAALMAGALGVIIVSPRQPTLGASGAIFGLLGAAAAYQYTQHINIWRSGLGQLIGLNVLITLGFASFISVGGHLGGLIGGAVVGYVLFMLERRGQSAWQGMALSCGLAVVFGGAAILLAPTGLRLR
jgi:membrane associated rhomboid family serine protease